MKRYFKVFAVIVLLLITSTFVLISQQEQQPVKEYVKVENVELIVRALLKGNPLGGLKAEDFILLENGKQIKITSFSEVRRKIGTKKSRPLVQQGDKAKPRKKRLFLMYFWINEREMKYQEALDFFFKEVYREGDIVLVVVKNQVFQISNHEEVVPALEWLAQQISKKSKGFRSNTTRVIRIAQDLMNNYIQELQSSMPNVNRLRVLRGQVENNLNLFFQEYKYRHLVSNYKQLQALAAELKKLDHEKWVLIFFQEEAFPQFNLRKMEYKLWNIDFPRETSEMRRYLKTFNLKIKMPDHTFNRLNKVKQAFVNDEVTFHVLWMDRKNDYMMESRDMEVINVFSGWMETFKGISKVTGGEVINGNKLKESLGKIVEREDIFYKITYAPAEGTKGKRRLEIKVKRPGVKVNHLTRVVR